MLRCSMTLSAAGAVVMLMTWPAIAEAGIRHPRYKAESMRDGMPITAGDNEVRINDVGEVLNALPPPPPSTTSNTAPGANRPAVPQR